MQAEQQRLLAGCQRQQLCVLESVYLIRNTCKGGSILRNLRKHLRPRALDPMHSQPHADCLVQLPGESSGAVGTCYPCQAAESYKLIA
jgi:hypothetical protein